MSGTKKRSAADELLQSMMDELKESPPGDSQNPSDSESADSENTSYRKTKKNPQATADDRTAFLGRAENDIPSGQFRAGDIPRGDRTVVVRQPGRVIRPEQEPQTKVSFGPPKAGIPQGPVSVTDAQLMQAENLKLSQDRITQLEREVERLREENEMLASAAEIAKRKAEDHLARAEHLERERSENSNQADAEIQIYKENMIEKEREIARLKQKVEELDHRLKNDLKKIRVRERELENRLELAKLEKNALARAKDEAILDLKRSIDQVNSELETYKERCVDLTMKIDSHHEQLNRTVRALRLALANLEVSDTDNPAIPLKKAE